MSRNRTHSDFDVLCQSLRDCRKPDVALGLLLAAVLVDEMPGIPAEYNGVLRIALIDAAVAVDDQAISVLAELLTNPTTWGNHAQP